MNAADDMTYMISSPSDVHCNRCDALNRNVDIFDDIRTGDWAYLFECRVCGYINDEHGNDLERGETHVGFVFTVLAVALFAFGWMGQYPPLMWVGIYVGAVVGIIAFFHGAKTMSGERDD